MNELSKDSYVPFLIRMVNPCDGQLLMSMVNLDVNHFQCTLSMFISNESPSKKIFLMYICFKIFLKILKYHNTPTCPLFQVGPKTNMKN